MDMLGKLREKNIFMILLRIRSGVWVGRKTHSTFNILVILCVCSVMSDALQPHGLYLACQAPLPIEFSRQEYWHGLLFPIPMDLPPSGIES